MPSTLVFCYLGLVDKMRSAKKHALFLLIAAATQIAGVGFGNAQAADDDQIMLPSNTAGTAISPFGGVTTGHKAPESQTSQLLPRGRSSKSAASAPKASAFGHPTSITKDAVVLNSRSFGIPFNVDTTGARPVEVRLYVSRGADKPWDLLERKPPNTREFRFKGEQDGLFWFATRTVDSKGQIHPSESLKPQLRVVVDTTDPSVKLKADAAPSGKVNAVLEYTDVTPIKNLRVHYASDVLRKWTSIDPKTIGTDGKLTFTPKEDWQQLSVQAIVSDSAGNQSTVSQLLRRPRVASRPTPNFAFDEPGTQPPISNGRIIPAVPSQHWGASDEKIAIYHPNETELAAPPKSRSGRSSFLTVSGPVKGAQPRFASGAKNISNAPSGTTRINPFVEKEAATTETLNTPAATIAERPDTFSQQSFAGPQMGAGQVTPNTAALNQYARRQFDPRQYDPRSLDGQTAPWRSMPIGAETTLVQQGTVPPNNTPDPSVVRPGQPFGPPSIMDHPPATTPNSAGAGSPLNGQPASGLPLTGNPANSLKPTTLNPQAATPPSMAPGTPSYTGAQPTSAAPMVTTPGLAGPNLNPANGPTASPGVPATMPAELSGSNVAVGDGAIALPNNGQDPLPRKPSRTPAEAMRPIDKNAESAQANSTAKPSKVDSPDYQALRQSQADYDRAMLAGRALIRYSDSHRFSLDYELEAIGAGGAEAVELYGSTDGGRSWDRWGDDPDKASPFDIETKGEGTFAFKIVVVSRNGLSSPRPLPQDTPDIVVVVDKTKPNIRLSDVLYGDGDRAGSLVIRYKCDEAHLMERPIVLSFSDSVTGPWTTIAAGLQNDGEYVWPGDPELPKRIYMRIDAKDRAGNVGTYVLQRPVDTLGLAPRARIRGFRSLGGETIDSSTDQTANRNLALPQGTFK